MSLDINNPFPFEGFEQNGQRERKQKPSKPGIGIITRLAASKENNLVDRTTKVVGNETKKVGWAGPVLLAAGLTTAAIAVNNHRESQNAPEHVPVPGHVIEVQQPVDVGQQIQVELTTPND